MLGKSRRGVVGLLGLAGGRMGNAVNSVSVRRMLEQYVPAAVSVAIAGAAVSVAVAVDAIYVGLLGSSSTINPDP